MNFELALYKGELECQLTLTSMIHNLSHFYFPIYPCSGSVLKTQPLFLRFQPRVKRPPYFGATLVHWL